MKHCLAIMAIVCACTQAMEKKQTKEPTDPTIRLLLALDQQDPVKKKDGLFPARDVLHYCADIKLMRTYIALGVDINYKDKMGSAALHTIIEPPEHIKRKQGKQDEYAILERMNLLLVNGADVNIKDGGGNTPLHYAVWHGTLNMARLLWLNGADLYIQNNDKENPLYCACERNNLWKEDQEKKSHIFETLLSFPHSEGLQELEGNLFKLELLKIRIKKRLPRDIFCLLHRTFMQSVIKQHIEHIKSVCDVFANIGGKQCFLDRATCLAIAQNKDGKLDAIRNQIAENIALFLKRLNNVKLKELQKMR